jgi:nicotinate dehydrogenase subunit B
MQRRQLLLSAALVGGGLSVSFDLLAQNHGTGTAASRSLRKEALDAWLALGADGKVTVYSGKVDLGTGIRTALMQMTADELEVDMRDVNLVMGDTAHTIDQGQTAGSLSISVGGQQLRQACATARQVLAMRAAAKWGVTPDAVAFTGDGYVRLQSTPTQMLAYRELLAEGIQNLTVDPKAPFKKPAQHRYVGKSIARVDIPAKVTGEFTYVHDVVLPGMVHARVLRPATLGAQLQGFDDSAARRIKGYVGTVHKGNFLAVVARSEWAAVKAMRATQVQWSEWQGLPEQSGMYQTWRAQPIVKTEPRPGQGNVDAGFSQATRRLKATYEFPIQSHASMGPSCALAQFDGTQMQLWSPSQATHSLQSEISSMLGLPKAQVRLQYVDGSGCYGRNGHEDCTADAALVAHLLHAQGVHAPVRLQWMREDEHGWDPKSPPFVVDLEAGVNDGGDVVAWQSRFIISMQSGTLDEFPLLAAVHSGVARKGVYTGNIANNSEVEYRFPNTRTVVDRVGNAFLRTSHLRTPGRMQNVYANECFVDEVAAAMKQDPVALRLRYLTDPRSREVVQRVAQVAGWQGRPAFSQPDGGRMARGRGFAYVRYQNEITYVAMVVDLTVDRETGQVRVDHVYCSHDCGQIINPDGTINQIEGGIVQTVSRTLQEEVRFDAGKVTSTDWATYPILRFPEVPRITVELINRPEAAPWGAGEMAPAVVPAAIGNAIFDAVGVRLRTLPYTPQRVLEAVKAQRQTA